MRLPWNSSSSDRHAALWLLLLKVLMVLLVAAAIGIYLWYGYRIELLDQQLRH